MTFLQADRALDDARRLVWLSAFSERGDTEVTSEVNPSAEGMEVARRLDNLLMPQVSAVLESARVVIWGRTFAAIPESRYGREMVVLRSEAPSQSKGRH